MLSPCHDSSYKCCMIHTVNFTSLSGIFRVENLIFSVPLKNGGKYTQSHRETEAQRKGLACPLLCNEFAGESHLLREIEKWFLLTSYKHVPHPIPETCPGIASAHLFKCFSRNSERSS